VHDELSTNRSWAYFEKQKYGSLFAFQPVRNQSQHIGPHYLSKSSAGFAQIIYVQLQFFDHVTHDFTAKGLNTLGDITPYTNRLSAITQRAEESMSCPPALRRSVGEGSRDDLCCTVLLLLLHTSSQSHLSVRVLSWFISTRVLNFLPSLFRTSLSHSASLLDA
jgi:hypothetical protein